jgi:hypothetical protein
VYYTYPSSFFPHILTHTPLKSTNVLYRRPNRVAYPAGLPSLFYLAWCSNYSQQMCKNSAISCQSVARKSYWNNHSATQWAKFYTTHWKKYGLILILLLLKNNAANHMAFQGGKPLKHKTSFCELSTFNRRYFWNWCIRSTKQITEIIHLWWGETNYHPEVPR